MKRVALLVAICSVAVWGARPAAQGSATAKAPAKAPAKAAAPAKAGEARTITITASDAGGLAHWDTPKIAAKPGESLHVVLKATGTMPKMAMSHNFVLLKGGTTEADITKFTSEAAMAGSTAYVPAADAAMVLAHTPTMVGAGETSEVTFKAPMAPGNYTYLCSFPGHYGMGMKGTLTVAK